MNWMRIALVIFLIAHAIGHTIWLIGAWVPQSGIVATGGWVLPGHVAINDPLGRVFGVLAGVAMVGFLAAAWAVVSGQEWWPLAVSISALLSILAIAPWLSVSPGSTAILAIAADIGLIVFAALPLTRDLVASE